MDDTILPTCDVCHLTSSHFYDDCEDGVLGMCTVHSIEWAYPSSYGRYKEVSIQDARIIIILNKVMNE